MVVVYIAASRHFQSTAHASLHFRINLSPFTKDFRGGEQNHEFKTQFFASLNHQATTIKHNT
jgi:hypothetical protein